MKHSHLAMATAAALAASCIAGAAEAQGPNARLRASRPAAKVEEALVRVMAQHVAGHGTTVPGAKRPTFEERVGTGIIWKKGGFILTTYSTAGRAKRVRVVLRNGKVLPALVKGADRLSDLAVRYPAIQELDFNPIFLHQQGLLIGDVRIILAGQPIGSPPGNS